ncbi:hypothetical protein PUN28_003974 [Cardiocondyla obscurior]|uniref:Uncharacterized protein n=1 Tax=Cardiocondyla obscurior TaxID=286306 RepID=A0AAW2GMR4_9HYME
MDSFRGGQAGATDSSHVLLPPPSLLPLSHVHTAYPSFSFVRSLALHFSLIVSLSFYVFVFLFLARCARANQSGLAVRAVALAQSTNGVMQRG